MTVFSGHHQDNFFIFNGLEGVHPMWSPLITLVTLRVSESAVPPFASAVQTATGVSVNTRAIRDALRMSRPLRAARTSSSL